MTYWNLYWVESDGEEDCFVVARNSRSARRVEVDMNGFDIEDVTTHKILTIPKEIAKSYSNKRKSEEPTWPWYAHDDLLEKLGAQFRVIKRAKEVLLDDFVYAETGGGYTRSRPVGRKAIEELRSDQILREHQYSDEDAWEESQAQLLTMLGMSIARCQQVECYLTNSFLLGLSEKEKKKYKTIGDRIAAWEKKPFGAMLKLIDESYEIVPELHAGLYLFKDMRNELVHGITTSEKYSIHSYWGCQELVAFLALFDHVSRVVRDAARASYYASIIFGNEYLLQDDRKRIPLTRKQKKEAGLFAHFFSVKKE
jgi:hypothetical protein